MKILSELRIICNINILTIYRKDRCVIENCSFEAFADSIQTKMKGKFKLICHDPPYSILEGVERDKFTQHDMERTVLHSTNLLHPEGTLVIFCSFEQYHHYSRICSDHKLIVDKVPLFMMKAPNSIFYFIVQIRKLSIYLLS